MYQQITLLGRCGNDPEQRFTPSGVAVTTFSLAVDKGFGEKRTTLWFRVTGWRTDAENMTKLITKGAVVLVVGELEEPRTYQDKQGNTRVSLEVTARSWRLVGNVAPKELQGVSVEEATEIPF